MMDSCERPIDASEMARSRCCVERTRISTAFGSKSSNEESDAENRDLEVVLPIEPREGMDVCAALHLFHREMGDSLGEMDQEDLGGSLRETQPLLALDTQACPLFPQHLDSFPEFLW